MHAYSQPTEYRFSHDSIEFAQVFAKVIIESGRSEFTNSQSPAKVLDLCAGCGIIGFEVAKLVKIPLMIGFVEVQSVYRKHFEENHAAVCEDVRNLEVRWLEMNYRDLLVPEFAAAYDLVVSNPPYFDREQGSLPPSEFKARCRFFLDSDFQTFLRAVAHVLKPQGEAYFLVRDLFDHGMRRDEMLDATFGSLGTWKYIDAVRGTKVVRFNKKVGIPRSSTYL